MLLPNLRGDGAVGMMLTLARGFLARGLHVDLLAVRVEGERVVSLPQGIRLINLNAKRSSFAIPAIVRYLRQAKPDVLMATEHYSGLPALYALLLARVATRCFIRQDNTWAMDSLRFKGRHKLVTPWMVGRLFRRAEIIAVSHGVAGDLATHFPHLRNNINVIYNPVISSDLFEKSHTPLDHPWFKPGEPPVVIAVGRLTHAKGFDVLIDAFSRIVKATSARLVILGDGPDRTTLEAQISANNIQGVCQLVGYQPNPYAYMAKASLFVLSSRFEGLPTVLIEALALGIPVISTDCPSGPREITAGGIYGTLVPAGDTSALATAIIERLSGHPCKASGLPSWLQQFAVDASVTSHAELIETALSTLPPHLRGAPLDIAVNDSL
jgi:glycosyltransferase involved in cell wall biosynthesis